MMWCCDVMFQQTIYTWRLTWVFCLQNLYLGSTETLLTAIEWTMTEILRNPSVRERAQSELDNVTGCKRNIRESDMPKLEYLSAIIAESFRLHPPAPLLMPHETTADCKISGYDIPANTQGLWSTPSNLGESSWVQPWQIPEYQRLWAIPRERSVSATPIWSWKKIMPRCKSGASYCSEHRCQYAPLVRLDCRRIRTRYLWVRRHRRPESETSVWFSQAPPALRIGLTTRWICRAEFHRP